MEFDTKLTRGKLIRRYKRFLADILLEDGREITAHCPNPGAMLGLMPEGATVWLEPNDDPRKKLKYGWRLVEIDGALVCVDTGLANKIVGEALNAQAISGLSGSVRAEVKYGQASRIDFLIEGDTYLEVKSVTLSREKGLAEFPDCVTARGAKHMQELTKMAKAGHRAAVLYVVQRTDCQAMRIAEDLDPAYYQAAQATRAAGVEMKAHRAQITPQGITLGPEIEIRA